MLYATLQLLEAFQYVKNVNPIRIVLDIYLKATTPVQRKISVSFQHSKPSHICILAVR
jgi:hypothetical protein